MRNLLLILVSLSIGSFAFGQNLRFSYSVSNPDVANNQSKMTVYVHKVGGGSENISGFNYGFYFKNSEATVWGQPAGFLSNNMTAGQLGLCVITTPASSMGWAPDITGAVTVIGTPPPGVPSGYDRLFTGAMVDGNGAGTDVTSTPIPIIEFILDNSVGGAPIMTDSAYQAGSDTNPAWEYSNINFEGFPVVITGDRLKTLPIELIDFNARKFEERHGRLNWSTASEINSSHFIVQRSKDKRNWTNAGIVTAAGNSQIVLNYEFIDQNVYNGDASRLSVYYRLQIFDLDGRMKYSPIESIVFGNSARGEANDLALHVYPNPASDGIQIEWDAENLDQPTSLEFYDVAGKLIHVQKMSDNTNQEYVDFEHTNIQAGLYLLRIMNGTEPIEHKQIVVGQNR